MTYIKIKTTTEKEDVALFPLKMISLLLLAIAVLFINLMLLSDTSLNANHQDDVVNNGIEIHEKIEVQP